MILKNGLAKGTIFAGERVLNPSIAQIFCRHLVLKICKVMLIKVSSKGHKTHGGTCKISNRDARPIFGG